MKKLEPIPEGALFTVTSGAYSDYSVHGVFRALKEIDAETLRTEWLSAHPDQAADYHFDGEAFLADMTRRGLLEPVDCWELFLEAYSTASEMDASKMDLTYT